ncbi:hypothetical protein FIBSPDRAFT_945358 [Athelia psychrophila]|uniref:Transmembrane protein 135 N-terminal domain-containing protein n=1 Tax=Athelia psychrophila TaxID=1759441 RepID=A0A166U5Q5_9AGAM|nr:hypothetical protein FIBSPDRAFT_945358 [Fibularhizoctonia sp. CBS 109695]
MSTPPPTDKQPWYKHLAPALPDDPNHPAQIALRSYALALTLSLGPSLLPFVLALISGRKGRARRARSLKYVLARELGLNGFAFAITAAVSGGALLQRVWELLEDAGADAEDASSAFGAPDRDAPPPPRFLARNETCRALCRWAAAQDVAPATKAFATNLVSSTVAILLLQGGRRSRARPMKTVSIPLTMPIDTNATTSGPSPTLDLTLLLVVRAVDATIQSAVFKSSESAWSKAETIDILGGDGEVLVSHAGTVEAQKKKEEETKWRQTMTTRIDAFIFWACSARIMWCFFQDPRRLPPSYVKWINTLANLDGRLLTILQAIRTRQWSYIHGPATPAHGLILQGLSRELGHPAAWGDPLQLPAYGGAAADATWAALGVASRRGVGGFPCEVVHGGLGARWGVGSGCTANAGLRFALAFAEAVALYLPVHFLPILLTRPRAILRLRRVVLPTTLHALRSATFLSTFVASAWYGVCLTRSLLLARLLPGVSHDFWDGPYGCSMAGALLCGASIWIENGRRRGEMALYVLPRAIRTLLPYAWMRRGNRVGKLVERLVFILSLASLLTTAVHRPDSLRGLSRWTLAFVMRGPNAGFWKRRKDMAQTPVSPATRSPTPHPWQQEPRSINGV